MHSLVSEMAAIQKLVRANVERGLPDDVLNFQEQMILMQLYPDNTCNQDALARMNNVDKAAIARTLAKLESKGLVMRTVNPANRRENLVSLAPKSAEALELMKSNLDGVSARAWAGFSDEERAQTLAALSRIEENLRKED